MDEMAATPPTETPAGAVAALVDGGSMDCGSGLLLLITRTMRRLKAGDVLGVRSAQPSVVTDLPVWAELVGHAVTASVAESGTGPWWFAVRKAASRTGEATPATVFSQGGRTPVGRRLWAYTNFDCNLACGYCCAESLEPEPTITADGAWWHPVAVTNPHLRIADAPLPIAEVLGVVRDTLAVHDVAAASGREVFRCA